MIRVLCIWSAASLLTACGPTIITVQPIKPQRSVQAGPPQTAEERDGKVPPLRGLMQKRTLVPEQLVPPEPPADPTPQFDVGE